RVIGPAWRARDRRAVPARRDRGEPVLRVVEGVPGSRQEAAGRRHLTREQPTSRRSRARIEAYKRVHLRHVANSMNGKSCPNDFGKSEELSMGGYGSGRDGGRPTIQSTASYVLSANALKVIPRGFAGWASIRSTYSDGFELHWIVDFTHADEPFVELRHLTLD